MTIRPAYMGHAIHENFNAAIREAYAAQAQTSGGSSGFSGGGVSSGGSIRKNSDNMPMSGYSQGSPMYGLIWGYNTMLKCSVMCGTAGVYMSSESGVTSDVMTSSTMSPSGPNRR